MKTALLTIAAALAVTSCSVKSSDVMPVSPFAPQPTNNSPYKVEPTVSCERTEAANGKIDESTWKVRSGAAFKSAFTGRYDVSLYDVAVTNPCNYAGSARQVLLRTPQTIGDFNLQTERSIVFYDSSKIPVYSKHTSNGQGQIAGNSATVLTGSFEAYVDFATGVCGQFQVPICN